MMTLKEAARLLRGEVRGDKVVCPGPGHSHKDRSMAVWFFGDEVRAHSYTTDRWQDCKDHALAMLGLQSWKPGQRRPDDPPSKPDRKEAPATSDHRALALSIWDRAAEPEGTLVERYLASRGVGLPDDAVRFDPHCRFGEVHRPAMVALVTENRNPDLRLGIHRTALMPDGSGRDKQIDKMWLGPCGGGVVRLTRDEDVTTCLGIAEGIEKALMLQKIPEFGRSPVWSALNAGGLEAFPVLPGIEVLWIAKDMDANGVGQRAADALRARWKLAGREVLRVRKAQGLGDLNDIAEELGDHEQA